MGARRVYRRCAKRLESSINVSPPHTSHTEPCRLDKADRRPCQKTVYTAWFHIPGRSPDAPPRFPIGGGRLPRARLGPPISRQSPLPWCVSLNSLLKHSLTEQLASSVCPVYCRFCTRSYSVGPETGTVSKTRFLPIQKRWEKIFEYIERTVQLHDIVVSGGDTFSLEPAQLETIGCRLLSISHVQRIRIASKGLAVCPTRFLDESDDWARTVIELSNQGRKVGKSVALHTHFNHPNEITWITSQAAQKLFENGVTVRNQTVLLRGVNNDFTTMHQLIQTLAKLNIQPVRCVAVSQYQNIYSGFDVPEAYSEPVLRIPGRHGARPGRAPHAFVRDPRAREQDSRYNRWFSDALFRRRPSRRGRQTLGQLIRILRQSVREIALSSARRERCGPSF